MTKESKSGREMSQEEIKIFAYGFDAANFDTPNEPITLTNIGSVEFIQFEDATNLDSADGVIIPQGIFEKIEPYCSDPYYGYTVQVDKDLLLDRERQVNNLIKKGKWVCFLVGEIVDSALSPWGFKTRDINDTDLCKKLLNTFTVQRKIVKGSSSVEAKANEFISYIKKYGVAKTIMELPYAQEIERRVIATAGDLVVGVEFLGKLFFLPFHTTKRDLSTTTSIVEIVTQAIFDYRQKRTAEIPDWADEFQFESEKNLEAELSSLREKANELQIQWQSWRGYKTILTTSGDILKNKLITILEDFFQLSVDPIDENREDAKIIDEYDKVLAMIEVKGTKRGIKREYINQVDSHRERNELTSSIPGVLFINNRMSVAGIDERLKTQVAEEQVTHAKNLNVLIVRTIDLLFLMKHLENNSDRKGELMGLLSSEGGWLKADSKGYEIVHGE